MDRIGLDQSSKTFFATNWRITSACNITLITSSSRNQTSNKKFFWDLLREKVSDAACWSLTVLSGRAVPNRQFVNVRGATGAGAAARHWHIPDPQQVLAKKMAFSVAVELGRKG